MLVNGGQRRPAEIAAFPGVALANQILQGRERTILHLGHNTSGQYGGGSGRAIRGLQTGERDERRRLLMRHLDNHFHGIRSACQQSFPDKFFQIAHRGAATVARCLYPQMYRAGLRNEHVEIGTAPGERLPGFLETTIDSGFEIVRMQIVQNQKAADQFVRSERSQQGGTGFARFGDDLKYAVYCCRVQIHHTLNQIFCGCAEGRIGSGLDAADQPFNARDLVTKLLTVRHQGLFLVTKHRRVYRFEHLTVAQVHVYTTR